jgi:uncharacterized protein (DUF362 family)
MSKHARVAVLKVENFNDPKDTVKETVKLAGGFDETIKNDSFITIKPNLVRIPKFLHSDQPMPHGCGTSYEVLDAVIDLTKKRTSNIAIIESDAMLGTTEQAFEKYKIYDLAKKYDLELINATKEELVDCEVPDPNFYVAVDGLQWLKSPEREMYAHHYRMKLPKKLLDSICITVPSMKTQADPYSAITFSVKNMFGILPEVKKFFKFHELNEWEGNKFDTGIGVGRALLDIWQIAPAGYAIIDGLWGLHGTGAPGTGTSSEIGVIIASKDPWAADTIAGEIVDFDMRRLFYFRKAEIMGLGVTNINDIEVVGEDIESLKVPFNLDVSLEAKKALDSVCHR